jgi:hypothetical protein
MTSAASTPSTPDPDGPDWVGWWRVRRYGGAPPDRPTYYEATPEHWDVIKAEAEGLYVARHPILSVEGATIHLKDEGEPDAHAEQWVAEVADGRLRVAAATGPHEGVVGVAERIDTDPRVLASS